MKFLNKFFIIFRKLQFFGSTCHLSMSSIVVLLISPADSCIFLVSCGLEDKSMKFCTIVFIYVCGNRQFEKNLESQMIMDFFPLLLATIRFFVSELLRWSLVLTNRDSCCLCFRCCVICSLYFNVSVINHWKKVLFIHRSGLVNLIWIQVFSFGHVLDNLHACSSGLYMVFFVKN